MKVGVISDTHGLLRPEAVNRLIGVDHIIHAGDIGNPEIIAQLGDLAPVTAIRGNNDTDEWASSYAEHERLTLAGQTIYVIHNVKELRDDPVKAGYDVVVSGHSHKPKAETIGGVLYLNPGSAGPRRFRLPITVAILDLTDGQIRPYILDIAA